MGPLMGLQILLGFHMRRIDESPSWPTSPIGPGILIKNGLIYNILERSQVLDKIKWNPYKISQIFTELNAMIIYLFGDVTESLCLDYIARFFFKKKKKLNR